MRIKGTRNSNDKIKIQLEGYRKGAFYVKNNLKVLSLTPVLTLLFKYYHAYPLLCKYTNLLVCMDLAIWI